MQHECAVNNYLILVQCADGSDYELLVEADILVDHLKKQIGAVTGVGSWQQQVFIDQALEDGNEEDDIFQDHDGGQLSDERALSQYIDLENLGNSEYESSRYTCAELEEAKVLNPTAPVLVFMLVRMPF